MRSDFAQNQNTNAPDLESVVIRFAGDSGDGMQVTGTRFTEESAALGNDLATRPDFPAEIRAPAGTIAGVSAFQIHFGSNEIFTAGDTVDVLIAMNPAALAANLTAVRENGIVICNSDAFTSKNLIRAGYQSSPLEDEGLRTRFQLIEAPISTLTSQAVEDLGLPKSTSDRCKNFFALGVICWLYTRGTEQTIEWINKKFQKKPEVAQANILALRGGLAFAQASELFPVSYSVAPAQLSPGTYRNCTGNQGLALGLVSASIRAGLPLTYAGYPITPASDILHEVAKHKQFGVRSFQAEDEIAACCAAIGAAYAGGLGVTASSGPGIVLKQEAIGLATMTELPLIIINVQRAGPSTGLPTKTEQSDLLMAMHGRNGECPIIILAAATPNDCFEVAYEACKLAIEHMTPVMLLSDGHIGNGAEPWKIPVVNELPAITPNVVPSDNKSDFKPYQRDPQTLARYWSIPGTKDLEHRIGGLEKQDVTGAISYDPENHERMIALRQEKVRRVAFSYPETDVYGSDAGDVLVISWGSTMGAVRGAVHRFIKRPAQVGHVHLRYLNPLPTDLGEILSRFSKVVVCELNAGQLANILRNEYLLHCETLCKIQGQQFMISEIEEKINQMICKESVVQ